MPEVTLNREAATALIREARRTFENAAREVLFGDESQRQDLEASVEVIGRLNYEIDNGAWPKEASYDEPQAPFEFSQAAVEWMDRAATHTEPFIGELEKGDCLPNSGDIAEQVYLLYVLRNAVEQGQREEGRQDD
jgi:hypothetical protein